MPASQRRCHNPLAGRRPYKVSKATNTAIKRRTEKSSARGAFAVMPLKVSATGNCA